MSALRNVLMFVACVLAVVPVARAQGIEDAVSTPSETKEIQPDPAPAPTGEKPGVSAAELPGKAPEPAPATAPAPSAEKPGASAAEPRPTATEKPAASAAEPRRTAIAKPLSDDAWTQSGPTVNRVAAPPAAPLVIANPQFSLRFGTGPVVLLDAGARAAAASSVLVPGLVAFDWKPTTLSMPLSFRLLYEGARFAAKAYQTTSVDVSVHAFEPSVAYDLAKGVDWNAYGRAGFALNVGTLTTQSGASEPLSDLATSFGLLAALGLELSPPPEPGTSIGLLVGAEVGWRQQLGGLGFHNVRPTGLGPSDPERISVTGTDWGTLDTSGAGFRFWAGVRF